MARLRNRLNLNRVFLVTVAHAGAGYEGRVVGVKDQVKVRRGKWLARNQKYQREG